MRLLRDFFPVLGLLSGEGGFVFRWDAELCVYGCEEEGYEEEYGLNRAKVFHFVVCRYG